MLITHTGNLNYQVIFYSKESHYVRKSVDKYCNCSKDRT